MEASLTTYSGYEGYPSSIGGVQGVIDDYHHPNSFSDGGTADNLIDNRANDDENYTDSGYLEMLIGNSTTPSPFNDSHSHHQNPDNEMLHIFNLIQSFANSSKSSNCDGSMLELGTSYKRIHGYLALSVCLFGVLANILIMVVLTRKEMRTPVNLMLFALAMADLLIMIEYIPFALHMYVIQNPLEDKFSLNWARFVFFHNHFTQILHTISIQLTLSMAIWRYVAIKCSNRSTSFCTFRRCYQVIAAAYICPLFFCILNYLYFRIQPKVIYHTQLQPSLDKIDEGDTKKMSAFLSICQALNLYQFSSPPVRDLCETKKMTLYYVEMSELAHDYPILHKMHFWTFSVIIKLIPCFVLTFFMCWLVNTLYKARRHHKMLERRSAGYPMSTIPHNGESQPLSPSKGKAGVHPTENDVTGQNGKLQSSIRKSNGRNSLCKVRSDEEERPPLLAMTTLSGSAKQMDNGKRTNGNIASNQLVPSPNHIQIPKEGEQSGGNSRRASGESGDLKETHNGMRRFTKGFIRFPSIRRPSNARGSKSSKRTDRTSKMLVAVLVLFLLTEFPQGIMHFLTGWYGPNFFRCYYNLTAEIWDILALLNSAVNFILYCFMSKQFRTQFRLSFNFHCFHKYKFMGMTACNNQATVSTTV